MPAKLKRRFAFFSGKLAVLKPIIIIVALTILVAFLAPKIFDFLGRASIIPRFITSLLFNTDIDLKTTEPQDETINILLLGIGGGNHDGGQLTDTIIFAHIDPTANENSASEAGRVTLVSIPRDLWLPILGRKINTAYETGEEKKDGGGLTLAKAGIGDMLGQEIQYAFLIDFSGFVKVVDKVGGLDIDVEQSFDDYSYPIEGKENELCDKTQEEADALVATASADPNISMLELFPCRVEHLHFDKGKTHMDGETALKYVRSRHALGAEGTDFARSKRQQKVIIALKDKVLSAGVLLNPFKLAELSETLGRSIDTDITAEEYDDFIKLAQKMKGAAIENAALDQGDARAKRPGLLENPPLADYGGAWVLAPRTGNFEEIRSYIACKIKQNDCPIE